MDSNRIAHASAHRRWRWKSLVLAATMLLGSPSAPADEVRANDFNDPFLHVTEAIPDCPPQEAPRITQAEMRTESHERAERGTRCYMSGQCRLPNAYLYDKEIIPRVKTAILFDGRFNDTSVSVLGQRRWVWLKGCVRSRQQSAALERLVRNIDDVEAVVNELVVLAR